MTKRIYAYTVEWVDSCSYEGWAEIDLEYTPSPITSVGWVVQNHKDFIVMTTCVSDNDHLADALVIPRCAIIKMKRVKNTFLERK